MNTPAPAVSVMMPVYNAERYVAQAVESILAQTFTNFEFLIVDDGSTDRSREILEEYARRDGRILLISRGNTGYLVALNEMIALARGALLARMDADDVALPDRLERQVTFLRDHPEVVCVGGGVQEIDERGRLLVQFPPLQDDAAIQDKLLSGMTAITHPTAMMRAEPVRAVGGYRPELYYAEDLDLWLRLGEVGKLANLPEPVLKYRVHEASICSRNHAVQAERMRQACEEASRRRGIESRYRPIGRFRPGDDRLSKHRHWLKYGWWAFRAGRRWAALRFGLRSVRWVPWRGDGWKLIACALLKKPARSLS